MSTPKRNEIAQKWLHGNYGTLIRWSGSGDTNYVCYKIEDNDNVPTVFIYYKEDKRLSNYDYYIYRFLTGVFGLTIVDIQFILKSWFEDCYGLEVEFVDVFGSSRGSSGASGTSGTAGTSAMFSATTVNHSFSANTENINVVEVRTRDPVINHNRTPIDNKASKLRRLFRLNI